MRTRAIQVMLFCQYSLHIVARFQKKPISVSESIVTWCENGRARGLLRLGIGLNVLGFVAGMSYYLLLPLGTSIGDIALVVASAAIGAIGFRYVWRSLKDFQFRRTVQALRGEHRVEVVEQGVGRYGSPGVSASVFEQHPVIVRWPYGLWEGYVIGVRVQDELVALASVPSLDAAKCYAQRLTELTGISVSVCHDVVEGRAMS